SELRDRAERLLASLPSGRPVDLVVLRDGEPVAITVQPIPACRTRFEVLWDAPVQAQSDGEIIQISSRLLGKLTDEQLSVLLAHELAHTILHHRERLEEAGVAKGVFAEFGRNLRLNRKAEEEADLLSVRLLRTAGYDPRIAPRFWRGIGRKLDSGLFRSRIYHSPERRAQAMEKEIARLPAPPDGPDSPDSAVRSPN
ncbi:MAG: M48 family metallopeptidase, partial [Novosphingobium sp.]|nr:M48 family metallopeptidase [Novosphingobium sp.]